ncbi:MAG: hypothetical protein HY912_02960 [Desulfomonile tiedjei]|uniref:F5/8 type C domain-containing protein n=1 Tax=Desulfomonile tiedjei TaxID=2358 RepID=A0A9D6UZA3_9BACT|nr:hypothetical protein [Desulfomonile tiedjei]
MGGMLATPGGSYEDIVNLNEASSSPCRLSVPPAYMQTLGARAVALSSDNHKIGFAFTPEVDFGLSSISLYVANVNSTGNVAISLHESDDTAVEPNGLVNGRTQNSAPVMTANNVPSPYSVTARDSSNNNAETEGFEAYKAVDGSIASDNGFRSNAVPGSVAPIFWAIDFGSGNAKIINKFRLSSFSNADANVRAFPKAFTLWGSNVTSPAYNTDADWVQVTGPTSWVAETDPGTGGCREYYLTNSSAHRHYRFKITDRNGSNAYTAIGEILLFEAESKPCPGTLIQSLGTKAVGSSGSIWIRHTFPARQLYRGRRVWLVFSGQSGADFSLCSRRWGSSAGSMFPDGCESRETTNGTAWTESLQDSKPALVNVVLNSTENHVPQLVYGRFSGRHVHVPGQGLSAVPESGIALNCETLAPEVLYNVYLSSNSGTLTLEASTTSRIVNEGIEVKNGSTSSRFLGVICPTNRISSYRGPIDTEDFRGVCNLHNRLRKPLGRRNPYSANTSENLDGKKFWMDWNNGDFISRIATLGCNFFFKMVFTFTGQNYPLIAVGINGASPMQWNSNAGGAFDRNPVCHEVPIDLSEGFYTIHPLIRDDMTTGGYPGKVAQYWEGGAATWQAYTLGTIEC